MDDRFRLAVGERFVSDYTTRLDLDLFFFFKGERGLIVMTAQRYGLRSCYSNRHSSASPPPPPTPPFHLPQIGFAEKEVSGWVGVTLFFDCSTKFRFPNAWKQASSVAAEVQPAHSVSQVTLQGCWFYLTPCWPSTPRETADGALAGEFSASKKCPPPLLYCTTSHFWRFTQQI